MKAMFVEEIGVSHYAHWLADGKKTIETRFKNTLKNLVGERVAIVRTRHGKLPLVVGYCVVTDCWFCPKDANTSQKGLENICTKSVTPKSVNLTNSRRMQFGTVVRGASSMRDARVKKGELL